MATCEGDAPAHVWPAVRRVASSGECQELLAPEGVPLQGVQGQQADGSAAHAGETPLCALPVVVLLGVCVCHVHLCVCVSPLLLVGCGVVHVDKLHVHELHVGVAWRLWTCVAPGRCRVVLGMGRQR